MSSCSNCCDTCQHCVNCDDTCDVCQSFCQLGNQLATDNGLSSPWPKDFKKDDIIIEKLPQSTFNAAIDYVIAASSLGTEQNSGGWKTQHETRSFIYADKVNELIQGIDSLGGGTITGVGPFTKDTDIIYASYFTKISEALSGLLLNEEACDNCNIECNVTCDTCDSCDSCEGSNSYWPSSWHGSWSGSWSGSGG